MKGFKYLIIFLFPIIIGGCIPEYFAFIINPAIEAVTTTAIATKRSMEKEKKSEKPYEGIKQEDVNLNL